LSEVSNPRVVDEPSAESRLREFVVEITQALVDLPDEVRVDEVRGATTTVYEVAVAKSDVGKLIGRSGRTLQAFRTVVAAVGTKLNRKAILEVIE
jgi:hypothetical protein